MDANRNDTITTLCNQCKNMPAEIFQENGDYCLDCWQELVNKIMCELSSSLSIVTSFLQSHTNLSSVNLLVSEI